MPNITVIGKASTFKDKGKTKKVKKMRIFYPMDPAIGLDLSHMFG